MEQISERVAVPPGPGEQRGFTQQAERRGMDGASGKVGHCMKGFHRSPDLYQRQAIPQRSSGCVLEARNEQETGWTWWSASSITPKMRQSDPENMNRSVGGDRNRP